jgi:hypothetical protein
MRQSATGFVINNYAYVGLGACGVTNYNNFSRYDPIANTWIAVAPFPGPGRNGAFSFTLYNRGYVGLGYNYQNNSNPYTIFKDFWEYEPVSDVWKQLPDFPGGKRHNGIFFSLNDRGYFGLGSDTIHNVHYMNDIWEYRPVLPTSILEQNQNSGIIEIYPTLVNSHSDFVLHVVWQNIVTSPVDIFIYNLRGQVVFHSRESQIASQTSIDLSHLSVGTYLVNVVDNMGKRSVVRIVKQGN